MGHWNIFKVMEKEEEWGVVSMVTDCMGRGLGCVLHQIKEKENKSEAISCFKWKSLKLVDTVLLVLMI